MTATLSPRLADTVMRLFATLTRLAFALPAAILAFLVYAAISFDFARLAQRARFDNAAILLSDFWSHKPHVTRDNRTETVTVAIEGETKGTYPDRMLPDWVAITGSVTTIDLGQGHAVSCDDQGARYVVAGSGTIDIRPEGGKPVLTALEPIPDWISVSDNKVGVTTDAGRFSHSRSKVETFKCEPGWELWVFTLESPSMASPGAIFSPSPPPATGSTRPNRTSDTRSANSGPTRCGGMVMWSGRSSRPSSWPSSAG